VIQESMSLTYEPASADTRVYEPQIRARLGTAAHSVRLKDLLGPVTRVKKKKAPGTGRSRSRGPPSAALSAGALALPAERERARLRYRGTPPPRNAIWPLAYATVGSYGSSSSRNIWHIFLWHIWHWVESDLTPSFCSAFSRCSGVTCRESEIRVRFSSSLLLSSLSRGQNLALTVLHVALTVLYVALTVLYVALTVLYHWKTPTEGVRRTCAFSRCSGVICRARESERENQKKKDREPQLE